MTPGILSAKGDAMSLTIAVSAFSLIARCGVAYLRACQRPPGSTAFHRDYPDDPLGSACPPVRHEAGWCPLTKPRGGRDRLLKSVHITRWCGSYWVAMAQTIQDKLVITSEEKEKVRILTSNNCNPLKCRRKKIRSAGGFFTREGC